VEAGVSPASTRAARRFEFRVRVVALAALRAATGRDAGATHAPPMSSATSRATTALV
jgi:hypothetical protein